MLYTTLTKAMLEGAGPLATTSQKREAAAAERELVALIGRDARRVANRRGYLSRQRAADFLQEAPGHAVIALLGHFGAFFDRLSAADDMGTDPAFGYVRRVLENHYCTIGRQVARAARQLACAPGDGRGGDGGPAEPLDAVPDARERDASDRAADRDVWEAGFAAQDVERIAQWDPADVVVLLGIGRLVRKLPHDRWELALAECGIDPDRVPCDLADDPAIRPTLARLLRVGRAAIDQRWKRGRHLLGELRFVRETLLDNRPMTPAAALQVA